MALAHLLTDPSVTVDRRFGQLMRAFEEVTLKTMRGSSSLDSVLLLVGQRLCELLEVRRCSVYLRRDDGLFQGRAGWCRNSDLSDHIQRLVSGFETDRFTREIAETGEPVLVTDAPHDPRTIRSTMRRWRVHDMLGVPLVVDDAVIGIIYVDNEEEPHAYDAREIAVAQAFAGLAAMAVRQGWLHSELEQRTSVIDRQRLLLQRLADTHTKLTHAVLDGVDLGELLRLIAHLVDKPVLLYSPRFELQGWAAPDRLELTNPPAISSRGHAAAWVTSTLEHLQRSRAATLLPPAPEVGSPYRQLVCPLRIDRQLAGFLDVVELGRRLGPFDSKVLERAAMAVSLQMLAEHRQAQAEGQARQDYVSDLLHGYRTPEQLRRRAPRYGIDLGQPHVVIRVVHDDAAAPGTVTSRRTVVEEQMREGLGGLANVTGTSVPGADLLLVGVRETEELPTLEARLGELQEQLQGSKVRMLLVSTACNEPGQLPQVCQELQELQELSERLGSPPRLLIARRFRLLRLSADSNRLGETIRFAEALLAPLRAIEGPDAVLLHTLQTYVMHDANVRETSRVLDVHENTVRYRLGRIREHVALDDLDDLMSVRVALQVLELRGELETAR